MRQNKSYTLESLFGNLARIICIIILFIVFGGITYRFLMSLNINDKLSIFAIQFYTSILQVIIMILTLKYCFKRENIITREDGKGLKINSFDILIFLLIGLLLKSILCEGLFYLERITNTGPKYDNYVIRSLIEGMQITNLDKIYSLITGAILGSIVEELFFRKGVFEYFIGKDIRSRSVVLISGISFGLAHSMGWATAISAMVSGIIFAVMYVTTENVIYPIIGHGLNNLMPFITTIFRDNSGIEDIESYIEAGKVIEIRGAAIISLILLIITGTLSHMKRKVIISSDFKDSVKKIFTE